MGRLLLLLILCFTATIQLSKAQIAKVELDEGSNKVSVEDIVIVFKMHFDIGYTDWAESVLQRYSTSMIDETLRSIEQTSTLPKEEQFIWTLPSWPMKYILENCSPENKPRVEQALRDGRLAPHALPLTYETEASDLETLVRGLSYASDINRRYGQPLTRGAKLTDVPSHSWIIPSLLTKAGVDILHIGCNSGSTSPDVPTLFWWEGPDGSRLLTFNWAEYYGSGVMPPAGWRHKTWLAMVHTHENTGAPSPEEVVAILKEAQEKAPNARIRIGKLEDFHDLLMRENPSLPVVRGDMPDTWIHGYMSMPREMKISKSMQRLVYNSEALNTLLKHWGITPEPITPYIDKAVEQLILFDEHTFGLALSHGNQGKWTYGEEFAVKRAQGEYEYIEEAWYEKGSRIHKARHLVAPSLRKDLKKLAHSVQTDGRKVVVYNPLPWERSGTVALYMGVWHKDFDVTGLKDEVTGDIYPVENDFNYLSFIAQNIPAMGYKTFSLLTDTIPKYNYESRIDKVNNIIENRHFRLTIDPRSGALKSVWDKKRNCEMVDTNNEYGFGEYINEKFGKEEIDRYNSAYVKPGHHGWADQEMARLDNPKLHYQIHKGEISKITYQQTPVSVSATSFCQSSNGDNYTITYTLSENSPYIELCWGINNKQVDPQPEAGWIAFPFKVSSPMFHLGRTGAVVNPHNFVKNTNHDYFFLNTGMAIVDQTGSGFGLNTPHAPAVSLDRPGLYRFSKEFMPKRPNVFVNLFNTQWGTNFTEWIDGSLSAKIYLWSIEDYANEPSLITPTEETRVPLIGIYAESTGGTAPLSRQGVELSRKGVLVTALAPEPNGKGTLLRLWEQAGNSGKLTVNLPKGMNVSKAVPVNLRGEKMDSPINIKSGKLEFELGAYTPVSFILQ